MTHHSGLGMLYETKFLRPQALKTDDQLQGTEELAEKVWYEHRTNSVQRTPIPWIALLF